MLKMPFAFFFLFPVWLLGTELAPWYNRYLELQPKAVWTYQGYQTLNTTQGNIRKPSHDNFLDLGISAAYSVYSFEIETHWASTRHRHFGFADLALTGRYQWWDDTSGNDFSLTTGLTVKQVFKLARNDISNFYQGGVEAEAHAALGKEVVCQQFWVSRLWGVLGFGIADIGSPWIRFNVAWEQNCWDQHQLSTYINTLWGLGTHGLHLNRHFRGYGAIRHQSIDIGIKYTYETDCWGIWSLDYSRRLYALNCPYAVNQVAVGVLYPFGL
jgi:hypothetical protein